ncbi:terminase small subunit [Mesobacterium pallidum]|uniref:terminase small subunit n=1 Tax=Mesobacterium pallidum TaxID=2872037 RepID=UPI001EE2BF64|nr:terminase small subunit [Mesobacterium pallidum]
MPALTNVRHEKFARAYVVDGNGRKAATSAGYAPKTAEVTASKLLRIAKVSERIVELREEQAKKLDVTALDVARRYAAIGFSDPRKLVQVTCGACRYCWGQDHAYHWRTEREFQAAHEAWRILSDAKRALIDEPVFDGGIGYRSTLNPNPECPECDGQGMTDVTLTPSDQLTEHEAALFASAKWGRNGIEVKLHDQQTALDALAKHLGLYKDDDANKAVSDLGALLHRISNGGASVAPIATGKRKPTNQENDQ